MKKRDKLSFREEIKVLLRNAMNRPKNKTLQDVIDYAKKYYLMDVRLRGNTISYALKYRTDKKGKPMVIMSLFLESPIRRQLLHRISEKEGKEQTGV